MSSHESKLGVQKINVLLQLEKERDGPNGGLYKGEGPQLNENEEQPEVPVIPVNQGNDPPAFVKLRGINKEDKKSEFREVKKRIFECWPIQKGDAIAVRVNTKYTTTKRVQTA